MYNSPKADPSDIQALGMEYVRITKERAKLQENLDALEEDLTSAQEERDILESKLKKIQDLVDDSKIGNPYVFATARMSQQIRVLDGLWIASLERILKGN